MPSEICVFVGSDSERVLLCFIHVYWTVFVIQEFLDVIKFVSVFFLLQLLT